MALLLFQIQGDRHLDFLQLCISDVIDKLQINVSMYAFDDDRSISNEKKVLKNPS